ncbi:MAG: hypothetical protein ACXAC5_15455 [Promethearchaeota archaeon]|jgi:AraC-like DNA-binding protein
MKRVKPLKFGFFGFGKHPKCKEHKINLVYVDERIGEFLDGALSCLFDIAGLPPSELTSLVLSKYPDNYNAFIRGWVYCITIGRGAHIISRYMDSLSNTYLKQLTKKQIKSLKDERNSKLNNLNQVVKIGMDEIVNQYTRLLKHLRIHSEVFTDNQQLKPISKDLRKYLLTWQKEMSNELDKLFSIKDKEKYSLIETKSFYDHTLNLGVCRCLLGFSPEKKNTIQKRVTAFDRFSAYFDFFKEGLTNKFTKSDIEAILKRKLTCSSNEKTKRILSVNKNKILDINPQNKKNLKLDINDLQQFFKHYIEKYDNFYSKRFKKLDLNNHRVHDKVTYNEVRRNIINKGHIPYIIYELFDTKTSWIRIGYSKYTATQRKEWYLKRIFNSKNKEIPKSWGKIYKAIQECETKNEAQKRFRMFVRYILPSKGEAKIMEEFLTIYRNKADNDVGFDLSVNNNYNAIVGDLFKGRDVDGNFRPLVDGQLAHNWRKVSPIPLAEVVLEGLGMQEIVDRFKVSQKTVRRRFKAYGYGVREIYDLKDARAFHLKPYIIEGIKRAYSQEEFFKYCEKEEGIQIFNKFKFVKNKPNYRGDFFRRMLKQIWGTSKHKEVRYQIIADYIISVITRPDITPGVAESEVAQMFHFKYESEFARICNHIFGKDFVKKRDEIFKPAIKKLALQNRNHNDINLKIGIGLGLCKKDDPIHIRERVSSWVNQYIKRNFKTTGSELSFYLDPSKPKNKTIKQQIFDYMEKNPIARPKDLKNHFNDMNLETIRNCVKEWKKMNRIKIINYPPKLATECIAEMLLDNNIKDLTIKFLERYISNSNPSLNSEWKGIVAGAIYLASIILKNTISQTKIASILGVDSHTISKQYREIAKNLNIKL